MQGPQFIYCLTDKRTTSPNFWQVAPNGMAKLAAKPYFLAFSPDGWLDIAIQNIRNKIYFGVDRTVTIPFGYVEDGANILKTIAYDFGFETTVYLKVCKLTLDYTPGVSYGYWYKQIYCGQVDLTEWNHDGAKITVTTLEDGLPKYLKANDKTLFELPMNVPEAIWVKDDGIKLHEKLHYADVDGVDVDIAGYGLTTLGISTLIGREGESVNVDVNSPDLMATGSFPGFLASSNYYIKNNGTTPLDITITGKVEFFCNGMLSSPPYQMKIRYLKSDSNFSTQNDYVIISTPQMNVGQLYSADINISMTLAPGVSLLRENIYFGFASGSNASIQFTSNSKFDITFKTRRATTYIRAFRPQYILQHLIKLVTDNTFTADGGNGLDNYFGTNNHSDKVITCGNAIRGFDDAVMKISLAIFFNQWNSFDAVGLVPIGTKVRLDRKKNLIDFTTSISLGSVSRPVISFYKENSFNELNIGYPEVKNENGNLNGNEAFCCGFTFSMGTMMAPGKLERVTEVIWNCYEIENIRNAVADKTTTDFKDDNKLFGFHINNTLIPAAGVIPNSYGLNRALNPFVTTGLVEPETVYNLEMTPKRNLYRMGDDLRSRLYKCDTKVLKYINADKNNKLITLVAGVTVEEKAPVHIGSLPDPFLLPVVITTEVIVPFNVLDLLDLNPLQLFDFDFDGTNYKGILLEVFQAPASDKQQTCKFLSVATNNISKLKDYYG